MKLLWTCASLAIFGSPTLAQNAALPASLDVPAAAVAFAPVPFAPVTLTDAELESAIELSDRGRWALENALFSEAVFCFKNALAIPNLDSVTKDSLNLDLVTAYLSESQLDQAAQALQAVAATDTPNYLLRAALLQARKEQWDGPNGAAALLARIAPGNVSSADLPWYFAAQAKLAEHQDNADAATEAWQQAIDHAPPLLQNQFQAALWDSQFLLSKTPTPEEVEKLHAEMDAAPLSSQGAHFASLYAIGLEQLGRHDDALKVVKQWVTPTDLDHKNRDMLRLIWVYLYGKGPPPADPALNGDALQPETLLKDILQEPIDPNSPDRDSIRQMQGQALDLLEQQAFGETPEGGPAITDPASLEKFIDGIIADQEPDSHPLLKELYLFKAQLALLLNQPDQAKTAASQLLEKYPPGPEPDPYTADAQMVLAQVYWHDGQPDGQPRLAINYLLKVRDSLPAGQRAPIERSLANLYFMNGDYPNAAESYTDLLNHPDSNSPVADGKLLLRAVESELRAGSIDGAEKILDNPLPADITADDRWRAEYTLLIAMRDNNLSNEAFQRLDHKLDPEHGKNLLQPEMYLRLLWLDAYLAVGQSEPEAGKRVELLQQEIELFTPEVMASVAPGDRNALVDLLPRLRAEALLLQGTAEGQAQQFDEQHKTFETLRQTAPGTDPALNSYFAEASELENQNKFIDAQRLYNTVAENFPKSKLAPLALYLEACDAEKSDKTGKYTEALNLLGAFMLKYSDSEAGPPQVFEADQPLIDRVQLEQADLERNIKEDPKDKSLENAADLYALLIKKYPNDPLNPLTVLAKIGRAECLYGLATLPDADPQRRSDAIDEFQVLYNQTNLPVDARVEVGYLRGNLLEYGDKPNLDEAADAYAAVVKDVFSDQTLLTDLDHTPDGRSWMLKCLTSLQQVYERQHKDTEAANIAGKIAQYGLAPAASPASTVAPVVGPAPSAPPPTTAN